ncbi:MAG: GlxA family transcriptional regulator, partial [Pseudaminobacter sp.]
FTHMAFSCAVEPLRIANLVSGKELYRWSFASADGKTAASSNDVVTLVHHRFDDLPACDRLFVLSGINVQHADTCNLLVALRRERARGTRIGALCSGAYILAKAGFLNGMQAAIHWEYHDSFMEEFPDVSLVQSVFVPDAKFITASGGTAAADLMLYLIEQDHGYDLSVAVADQMVYNAVRNPTAAQRVSFQSRNGIRNRHLAKAIEIMRNRIDNPVSLSEIARELGISTRQIERLFGTYLRTSPKKYFTEMRLERARHLLVQTESAITEVALACGFGNFGHFSRTYRAVYGVSPMMQRGRLT